mmetsp:Transcript_15421/g.37929  ORF Transcript_15421/g.37929 Transcript_15421/m.37929 type:complete len:394 (+) Transcript_15421:2889-4070(+)
MPGMVGVLANSRCPAIGLQDLRQVLGRVPAEFPLPLAKGQVAFHAGVVVVSSSSSSSSPSPPSPSPSSSSSSSSSSWSSSPPPLPPPPVLRNCSAPASAQSLTVTRDGRGVRTGSGRAGVVPVVGVEGLLPARRRRAAGGNGDDGQLQQLLLHDPASAERHGDAAHWPCADLHPARRPREVPPHARRYHRLDPWAGPRRHRDAERRGAPNREGDGGDAARPREGEARRGDLGLEGEARRAHQRAAAAAGRLAGLVPGGVHAGRQGVRSGQGGVRPPPRRRPRLPLHAPRQLVLGAQHRALRRRDRPARPRRADGSLGARSGGQGRVRVPAPVRLRGGGGGGRGGAGRRHDAPGDALRGYRGRRPPGGPAVHTVPREARHPAPDGQQDPHHSRR